jgi:hypothetical protein
MHKLQLIFMIYHDSLAERSKAVAQGAIPQGRGFEPHSCHYWNLSILWAAEILTAEATLRFLLEASNSLFV